MSHAVVIGAGSAGLATAVALRGKGFRVTVIERGDAAGYRWTQRYDGLRLNTARALSRLPGYPIPRSYGTWPTALEFAGYLRRYAADHRLDLRTNTSVVRVDRGWVVRLSEGPELVADVVVVATGYCAESAHPEWFGPGMVHAADYRRPDAYAGERVLVVGAGNSGSEIAVELSAVAEVLLSVRTPPLMIPGSVFLQYLSVLSRRLPQTFKDKASIDTHRRSYADLAGFGLTVPAEGAFSRFARTGQAPVAERGLADAVRSGRIRVVAAVKDAADGVVRLADGSELVVDTVIAATGYRPGFHSLVGHLDLPADGLFVVGAPSLDGDLRSHGTQAARVAAVAERIIDG